MTKKFEVGKYAINNKGIGIAGPQSTIYKVTALSKKKTMIGEVYVVELQERLSNGKYRYFWREIYVDMLTGQERCYYRGNKQGSIEPYDKERV